ncbi:MAG: 4Fe-4S dicluster domain-containing protein, partial [Proteobacteria bacterium]|nr:4Fe-4S dicluster domain-containing protein [Pseudomonadota bacterium]
MLGLEQYREALERCSQCGYCQASCPVFSQELLESYTARGRTLLIKAALMDGILPVGKRTKEIVANCLLCGTCAHTCPGGLPLDEIFMAARNQLRPGGPAASLKRGLHRKLMEQRGHPGAMGKLGPLAKTLGLAPADLPQPAARPFLADQPEELIFEVPGITSGETTVGDGRRAVALVKVEPCTQCGANCTYLQFDAKNCGACGQDGTKAINEYGEKPAICQEGTFRCDVSTYSLCTRDNRTYCIDVHGSSYFDCGACG